MLICMCKLVIRYVPMYEREKTDPDLYPDPYGFAFIYRLVGSVLMPTLGIRFRFERDCSSLQGIRIPLLQVCRIRNRIGFYAEASAEPQYCKFCICQINKFPNYLL
jgi:hypothetical protein